MSKLPKNWSLTKFTDVFDIQGGTQPPKSAFRYEPQPGYIQLLQIRDFGERPVPTYVPDTDTLKKCTEQDILIARYGASLGRILTGLSGAYNVAMAKVDIPEEMQKRFVYHLLKSEIFQAPLRLVSRSAQSGFNKQDLAEIDLPIAPLNEQKRIADKLDSLLVRVDACRDRLDRVPRILKQFRQSVVNAATSGELTKDWVYTDNPEVWQEALIGDLLVGKPRNGYSPRAVEFETETRSLTLTATTSGRFNPTYIKYIDEKIPEDSYLWLEPDDILIQRANTLEYVGVSAIYDGPSKHYIYPDLMMKCRANNRVLTKFLYHLLSSDSVRSYFRKNATGTTGNMPKINQQTVLSASVCVPPIDEQQEIVRRVDRLFTYADRLETRYRRAFVIAGHLTSRLLDKAFRGDLVPQDPDDEPASVLLERIRLMRTTSETTVTKPRQRKSASDGPSQSNVIMLKRKDIQPSHLSDMLKASGSMTAEKLWSVSQLEIDDFYDQLKDEEASGLLKETREESTNAPRLLEAV